MYVCERADSGQWPLVSLNGLLVRTNPIANRIQQNHLLHLSAKQDYALNT